MTVDRYAELLNEAARLIGVADAGMLHAQARIEALEALLSEWVRPYAGASDVTDLTRRTRDALAKRTP